MILFVCCCNSVSGHCTKLKEKTISFRHLSVCTSLNSFPCLFWHLISSHLRCESRTFHDLCQRNATAHITASIYFSFVPYQDEI